MSRSLVRALQIAAAPSFALGLLACNALTGASNLETCENCGELGVPNRLDGGGADGALVPNGDGDVPKPNVVCTANETRCTGKVAGLCVNNAWQDTPCAQACVAGKCEPYPSCRNAAGAGCGGPAGSCCETAAVPGGTFNRRNNTGAPATVSSFELDKYEVTVGRMRAFLAAGGATKVAPPAAGAGAHPKIANSGWQAGWNDLLPTSLDSLRSTLTQSTPTWTPTAGANEHLPINNVSWFVAFAFCAWDGGRLPTYLEWNYAAAGGSEQRVYPWSNPPNVTTIPPYTRAAYDCGFTSPSRTCPASYCSDGVNACGAACVAPATCVTPPCTGCAVADIAPVDALPTGAGRWGHLNLSGNVGELVFDAQGGPTGNSKPEDQPVPCVDCVSLPPAASVNGGGNTRLEAEFYVVGGGWDSTSSFSLRTVTFSGQYDNNTDNSVGFRCAR